MPEKKYFIRVRGSLVEVDIAIYKSHHKMRRRAKYLRESDEAHGKVSYHALDTDDYTGEEILPDTCESVEDAVVKKLMTEKLRKCLESLSISETKLIQALFYDGCSERKCAEMLGISQKGVNKRKKKILHKLNKLMSR